MVEVCDWCGSAGLRTDFLVVACSVLQRQTHDQHPLLMTLVSYRVATTDDVPAMARLRDKSGWQGGASEERIRQYLDGTHHPQFARAGRAAYLAESSGALAGFIAGHLTTRFAYDAEVQWLLVAPAHRGGSVATPLLEQLTAWFLRQEAPRVCVNVSPDNARARRFYQRHGALELAEHWMIWPDIRSALAETTDMVGRITTRP